MRDRLTGETVARRKLTPETVQAMLALLSEHYEQVTPESFARDLAGKDQVILLRDEAGGLQGFSTLALYKSEFRGQPIGVVYSGDTIIRPAYWGTPELPSVWVRRVLALGEAMGLPLYWLLISSGYKSYRFLPVFYRQFYPVYDQPTPLEMQTLMDQLARARFGADYDAATGIVRFSQGATPLRAGVAALDAGRLRNPHVRFYVARNPGHVQGDELVCLTRVHADNLTPAGLRMAGLSQPELVHP